MSSANPGGPALGWLCSYTPVEITMAAGYHPIRLDGGEKLQRSRDPRIYHSMCPFVRAVFQRYASGEAPMPESVVFVRCCDGMVRLYDVWKEYLQPHAYLLDLPKTATPQSVTYFAEVLRSWGWYLEQNTGGNLNNDALFAAIRLCNQARALFLEIGEAQRKAPEKIPYSRFHEWSRRWLTEPTLHTLEDIRNEWTDSMSQPSRPSTKSRVMLTSSMLDQPDLVKMIESVGLDIVAEDECMGARHYRDDVPEQGDPYSALAERYLSKWQCPRMKGHEQRFSHLDTIMAEASVEGVIMLQLKYCDQAAFDVPLLKAHLEKKQMPFIMLDNDYGEGGAGQIRTRIEAFAEMLQEPWA